MLRRLAGVPVTPENFVFADIRVDRLGPARRLRLRRTRNGLTIGSFAAFSVLFVSSQC
jgi:hypothetical protein